MTDLELLVVLLLLTALSLSSLLVLSRRGIIAFSRRAILLFCGLNLGVILLHLATYHDSSTPLWWFFNVDFENNFGSTLSSILLLSSGLLALTIALVAIQRRRWQYSLVWLVWGAAYLFLSYDELYTFHELIPRWALYFAALGALLVGSAAFTGWRIDAANRPIYAMLIAGLGITTAGGIGLEHILPTAVPVEEYLELAGSICVFIAAYTYFRRHLPADRWQPMRRLLIAGNATWVVAMLLITFWPLPALEARYLATPVNTEYLDGDLSLIGYTIPNHAYQPGDWVPVTLYWRANRPLTENYAQSVRLLRQSTGEFVAQNDLLLGPPGLPATDTWPTGVIFRKQIYLQTDGALVSPASYLVSLSVWRAPWDAEREDNMVIVSSTDRELLLPDTLVLARAPFISPGSEATPAGSEAVVYQFDNQFRLTGYELPPVTVTDEAPSRFWWSARSKTDQELIQFLHLQNAVTGEIFVLDHPPLDELPTTDWPEDFSVISEWNPKLFHSLPDGEYDVYTGLYDQMTVERIGVRDANDEPVLDNRIYLGTLTIRTDNLSFEPAEELFEALQ